MRLFFKDKAVLGTRVVLPAHEQRFEEDMRAFDFPEARSRKLQAVMGYDRHRLVRGPVCVSDLAVFAFESLFRDGLAEPGGIDALILLTQSPDHFVPATSNIIQGRLGLKQDCLCLDINQGCAGQVLGLIQAFMLLEQPEIRQVAVVVGDVISRKVCRQDRNSFPLTGDGLSVTLVANAPGAGPIHGFLRMDGGGAMALNIPAGGFREPSTPETALARDVGDGNFRARDHLCMDGTAVFNFVMREVPPMIQGLLETAGVGVDGVDDFFFHQPNRFMLRKLGEKIGIPPEKLPDNVVERFGNNSGVTIPTAYVHNRGQALLRESRLVCQAGFGVGLTWASLLMRMGPLAFCDLLDFPESPTPPTEPT